MTDIKVHNGKPIGFGAVLTEGGVNFSIYSRDATKVSLVLLKMNTTRSLLRLLILTRRKTVQAMYGTYI